MKYSYLMEKIKEVIQQSIEVKQELLKNQGQIQQIKRVAEECINTLTKSNKILICGNGGSAADAQHFAAEIVGRFKEERKGLPCIALTTDTSILTAVGNDYGFDEIFSRQVEALGKKDDLLICISTSGNSKNIVNALNKAQALSLKTAALTGQGGEIAKLTNSIQIPSPYTPRIQEGHILVLHILAELIENACKNE